MVLFATSDLVLEIAPVGTQGIMWYPEFPHTSSPLPVLLKWSSNCSWSKCPACLAQAMFQLPFLG